MLTEKIEQIKKILDGLDAHDKWRILLSAAPPHALEQDDDGQFVVYTDLYEDDA